MGNKNSKITEDETKQKFIFSCNIIPVLHFSQTRSSHDEELHPPPSHSSQPHPCSLSSWFPLPKMPLCQYFHAVSLRKAFANSCPPAQQQEFGPPHSTCFPHFFWHILLSTLYYGHYDPSPFPEVGPNVLATSVLFIVPGRAPCT